MKILFFIKAYNDVDHFSPIIHRLLSKSISVQVLVFSDLSLVGDYRIEELKRYPGLCIEYIDKKFRISRSKNKLGRINYLYKKITSSKSYIGKIKRKYFLDCRKEVSYLKDNDIHALVFEWSTPSSNGLSVEKYFRATKAIGLTTYSLPHGCNIYNNPDVNKGYVDSSHRGKLLDDAKERNRFDYYVFQGKTRRDQCVKLGYSPNSTQNWGSVRFYPEWQKYNMEICPQFEHKVESGAVLKVVFMDHQYDYNVFPEKILRTLSLLSKLEKVFVLVKASTREGKSSHINSYNSLIRTSSNIEFSPSNAHSPSLIKWSDCVINYGSSIGIEAILQNKPLITPTYLDSNISLFEFYNAGYIVNNNDELQQIIKSLMVDKNLCYSHDQRVGIEKLLNEIVYGGKGHHDVIEFYVNNITSNQLNY